MLTVVSVVPASPALDKLGDIPGLRTEVDCQLKLVRRSGSVVPIAERRTPMFVTFLMVLAVILIIVGAVLALRRKSATIDGETFGTQLPGRITLGVGVVMLMVMSYIGLTFSQDPGQARVLRSFTGNVDPNPVTSSGMHFKAPWITTIEYDVRNQVVSYVGDGKDQTGPAITAQDQNGATATIDIVVRYSIDPTKVVDIYKGYQTQDNFVARLIQNDVRSVVRDIPLKYTTTTFRLNRQQAALEMQKALSERWKDQGINVEAVDLRNIIYPENIEKSLQAVQEATNNANKALADLQTAKVEAEKTRVEAQAQSDYDQIVRCGAKTIAYEETINGQKTTGTKVIPLLGDECQNKLNEQVLTNKYIDALKELASKPGNVIITDGKTVPMVNIPAPTK